MLTHFHLKTSDCPRGSGKANRALGLPTVIAHSPRAIAFSNSLNIMK
ncbi:hypothetical protein [Mastigocladopsis repens]|nr:hypothetical protein [Mastigocladopsis repens]